VAKATAVTAVDMSALHNWAEEELAIASTTHIRETGAGGRAQDYYGVGFDGDPELLTLTAGTLTGTTYTIGGNTQYTVTGLNHSIVKVYKFWLDDNMQGMAAYLFNGNDTLNGSAFADTLNGFGGNDTINGGNGNDTMIWGAGDRYNGGAGTDTLKIASGNVDLTAAANSNSKLLNTEQVDLRSGAHTLTLNRSDVLDMSSTTNTIKVLGDAGDMVNIVGTFTEGAVSGAFTAYALGGGAKLLIDSDINVI
jgi:Ca2+-binding RTX toxin-like protein